MNSFKDGMGRQWICRIDVAAIRRVRSMCNVDLANLIAIRKDGSTDTNVLQSLADDSILLVDVLNAVILPQLQAMSLTGEEWAESVNGQVIEDATYALIEGVAEFFPPQKKTLTLKLLEMTRKQVADAGKLLEQVLSGMDSAAQPLTGQSSNAQV